jgi:hypothetical protein
VTHPAKYVKERCEPGYQAPGSDEHTPAPCSKRKEQGTRLKLAFGSRLEVLVWTESFHLFSQKARVDSGTHISSGQHLSQGVHWIPCRAHHLPFELSHRMLFEHKVLLPISGSFKGIIRDGIAHRVNLSLAP